MVQADALATAERVRASEGLLHAAIFAELNGVTVLLFAALALFELFKRADPRTAGVMLAMMLVSVPISYVNVLNHVAPLVLLNSPAIAAVLDPGQIAAQVTLFLRLHNFGLVVNQIFWGLWLFPIGILVLRSGSFPRWLAWNLQILGIGEAPFFAFYLLIWGVRGYAVDRISAFLVLVLVAMGIGGGSCC
jgi:hypothetical protein